MSKMSKVRSAASLQKNAVLSLLLLKISISTRFPTSNSAMTSCPWKHFVKADLPNPLVLPDLWGKSGLFLLSFRIMYRLKENVVLLTKSAWRDMIEIQLLIHMRALFFHIKKFLRKCLVIKRRWLYSNSKYHPAACTFWQGLWVLFLKAL